MLVIRELVMFGQHGEIITEIFDDDVVYKNINDFCSINKMVIVSYTSLLYPSGRSINTYVLDYKHD
jgi:hypothetical protein